MIVSLELRCQVCNRLFGKLVIDESGKARLQFKCRSCSKTEKREHICSFNIAEIESFPESLTR